MVEGEKPNFLVTEKSPYLLEHAMNPVEWRPWGDEALNKSKNDGKPILLSIGYSTCHWCHVMRSESFEDAETARIINKNFIPIKVDREERPELDSYYMSAVQSMTGGGGWPLTVFLTPDLKPFYGGTYFPPEPRFGMPGFKQVLEFVARIWRERRDEALASSEQVSQALLEQGKQSGGELTKDILASGYTALASIFDERNGGFGGAPKFPLPLSTDFMLRYHSRNGTELALRAATKTLDEMARGGIRDHLGGGFHRYATDRVWLVPHFEKMLYDNALLAKVYIEAFQVTGAREYARVASETIGWMISELRDDKGGFYSAQDADTAEGEGVYYTWTPEEIGRILGSDAGTFCSLYGITRGGNFEGRTILHADASQSLEKRIGGSEAEVYAKLEGWKRKLYEARLKRPRPKTDEKVLTSWNGLAISALSMSGSVLGDVEHLEKAAEAAEFVLKVNSRGGNLLRRSVGGEAGLDGTLEDYAFFVQGLLDLFDATSDPRWLKEAERLTRIMVRVFHDKKDGGFYSSQEEAPWRRKEDYDGPTPSGNSVAVNNLIRLAEVIGDSALRELAANALKLFASKMEDNPAGHSCMLGAVDLLVNGQKEVVITANDRESAKEMTAIVRATFMPGMATIVATQKNAAALAKATPLLEGRSPGKKPVAYVCENFTCKLPATTPDQLREQLNPRTG
ncbi:MAG: thioredoxin domain-containing protein [Thaumarchaeota archaeon]|nr:thioredoxin domain-containing protein [Nitrososphaerota archaeon]